jgi:hypothetical protein
MRMGLSRNKLYMFVYLLWTVSPIHVQFCQFVKSKHQIN